MEYQSLIAINRSVEFSPFHVSNDAAILQLVSDKLSQKGHIVTHYTEDEFAQLDINQSTTIFHMARRKESIDKLQLLQAAGSLVMNPPKGVLNCVRKAMTSCLLTHQIGTPASLIIDLYQPIERQIELLKEARYWVKMGDGHAQTRADVSHAAGKRDVLTLLEALKARKIESAVVNEHVEGDLIKFYGVFGTDFFYSFYPQMAHSKFGLEQHNGVAKGLIYDHQALHRICNQASQALSVPIYGGDCIVTQTGEIKIIDFNDFPTFAPCRETASDAIADFIELQMQRVPKISLGKIKQIY